ncbi:sugar phosphate nucleotidyltransferase [Natronolimnohabitans innermongolicus]|uniref:Nucleotidyltransferase n=1 Tax=Natronolimnohabitans innermongolicus JCM 12255 TaxID=1227499 RepID=L9XGY9_9EURY|nr:sugar phosphate nucleotidyltransferase [Natronolimnohabitans innermongolicus]ELY60676.1 nucleotidyltransferase [Natronolimnohabitans innermongolicus JCM 12255]
MTTTTTAVVLAGGYATRLWPLTRHRPKMFLPLGETTVIERIYAELEAIDRIDEVYVSTNERFAADFEAHLADSPYEKPRLSVEETEHEDEKLGVVGALAQLIDREGIDDDLLVIAGDNRFDFALEEFLEYFDRREGPAIAAHDVGSRERATSYGVLELDGERVVDFQEKPDEPESTLVSIGCYAFPGETLSLFGPYLEAGNDPDEPGWFVQWLQDRESTYAYVFEDAWFDIGTRESYLDAVAWALDGESRVADSATVRESTVGDGVHVLPGATLVDADVERSVVFPDATLESTTVRRSVVDEGATISGYDLDRALIGAYTRLPDER